MKELIQVNFKEERALFHSKDLEVINCTFDMGESSIKECKNINVSESSFKWKYPIWYSNNIYIKNCILEEMARASMWYVDELNVSDTVVKGPKGIRKCNNVILDGVIFTDGNETLWKCKNVNISNVTSNGDYFGLDCENMKINHLNLIGHYCLDGIKNTEIRNSKILSRDAFWNSENVTVYDSYISGEYIGWNSKNLTFINCTIESLQGLCYIENLVMINCKLVGTTLAFEYSSVDAEIDGKIDSVMNPRSGRIVADEIEELILEEDKTDVNNIKIIRRIS